MSQIFVRFVLGGLVVTVFAVIGDVLKPKSFAGLFGAAPSVALATLGMTIAAEGAAYTSIEGRSMLFGAIAFFLYASLVSQVLMRYKFRALQVTLCLMPLWLGVAGSLYYSSLYCCTLAK